MKGSFQPWPIYVYGTVFIGEGVLAFIHPTRAYRLFGVPLPPSRESTSTTTSEGPSTAASETRKSTDATRSSVSPLVYAKAARDITTGLAFWGLQLVDTARGEGVSPSVTVFSAALMVTGVLDGWIVWRHGGGGDSDDGQTRKKKALSHWAGTALIGLWVGLRVMRHMNATRPLDL